MNTNQTLSQEEKDALLLCNVSHDKINGKDLIWALVIFLVIFLITAPKIYFSGQIYYLSRDIAKIDSHLELLQEENKKLKQELEDFRFQQILRMDTL